MTDHHIRGGDDGGETAGPISCRAFESHVSAFLDRELEPTLRAAMGAHQLECADCARLLAELGTISSEADALPILAPEHDLWRGIEARITTPPASHPSTVRTSTSQAPTMSPPPKVVGHIGRVRTRWLTAAAAALFVAAGASAAYRLLGTSATSEHAPSIAATTDRPPDARLVSNSGTPDVTGAYTTELEHLQAEFEARRSLLDTSTVRVLESNLAIIDRAIRESRAALAADPASSFLNQQLSDVMGEKLELIRTAVILTSGA